MIGYARTEETLYDRPTPEKLALDEAGLKQRVGDRLGIDPVPVIDAYRKARAAFQAGQRNVVFPAGTYWLRVFVAVRCGPWPAG